MMGTMLMLFSCTTEDRVDSQTDKGERISFAVSTDRTLTRGQTTLPTTPLTGYTRQLWLVPRVTEATATRGTQLGSEDKLASFGVSAYLHPQDDDISEVAPDYFYNLQATAVEGDEDGNYAISQDYYWPASDEALTFYAYAPYGDTKAVVSAKSQKGPQTISFSVASDVTQQIDLMTAIAAKQKPSTTETPSVALTFKHQLAGVRFVIGDQFLKGWIKSITLKSVYGRGTYTIGRSWDLSDDAKTDYSVTYATDRPVTGAANQDVTTQTETFLMIPQTLGGTGQQVEIVYQDEAHNDYTVKAALTGKWEAGKTYTYAISSTDLTTLRISTISFPVISGSPKTAWAKNDAVGMYVVGSDGTTLIHKNVKVTYNGTSWDIAHPAEANIYDLPGQTYFFYYPYSNASSGQPIGYPEGATSADESADDFFANVVDKHVIATNQSAYDNFTASDLCIAKATHDTPASTIKATLARKVGLAFITLSSKSVPTTVTYTNNGSRSTSGTTTIKASSSFSGNTPYNNSSNYCAFVKASTNTTFSSVSTGDDRWKESIVANIAAGASASYTAYSRRNSWTFIKSVYNYTYANNNNYTFTAPITGKAQLEVWGAQVGRPIGTEANGNTSGAYGGKGGYAKGTKQVTAGNIFYVCIGGQGGNSGLNSKGAGGYNGGGSGGSPVSADYLGGAGGGGATHISINTKNILKSVPVANLLIAAGGGGGAVWQWGGSGGGANGGNGPLTNVVSTYSEAPGGGQSAKTGSAYGQGQNGANAIIYTDCACEGTGGGGGGYYGGCTNQDMSKSWCSMAGAGGSGYIGGVTGGSMSNGQREGNGYATITVTYE